MSRHRFFLASPFDGGAVPLSAADLRHAARVLRLRAGEEIVAVEPGGRQVLVQLTSVTPTAVSGEPVAELDTPREPLVVLVQGVGKGEKTDLVVQKAVEIGVAAIVPVLTARSVVRWSEEKRAERGERWRRVAEGAAKQAQRAYVPRVDDPVDIAALPAHPAGAAATLVCHEGDRMAPGMGVALGRARANAESGVAVVVGPEGGLTDDEVGALVAAGAQVVGLGPTVLRTETAGVVAGALALYELGGLGGPGGGGLTDA